jgi:hypothetical protein
MTNSNETPPKKSNPSILEKILSVLSLRIDELGEKLQLAEKNRRKEMFSKLPINTQIKIFLRIKPIADFVDRNNYLKQLNDTGYCAAQIHIIQNEIPMFYYDLFFFNSFKLNTHDIDYKIIRSLDK